MKVIEYFRKEFSWVFIHSPPSQEEKEDEEVEAEGEKKADCFCYWCHEQVEPSRYYCCGKGFEVYLHERCAELELASEIDHPLHPHPLFFHPVLPYSKDKRIKFACNLCGKKCFGSVYDCRLCDWGLDTLCAYLQPSTISKLHKLQHFAHQQHPLLLINGHNYDNYDLCTACDEPLSNSGEIYICVENCNFYLHKKCGELPTEINHPFHPPHPLILLTLSPSFSIKGGVHKKFCRFCHGFFTGFVYRCDSCDFDLDVNCALLQLSTTGDFHQLDHFSHDHPLIFNVKYNKDVNSRCSGCLKPIVDPFYRCLDCNSFDLHKECVELPRQINHPYHRKHPLTLLLNLPIHPQNCSCYWCKVEYKGFIYYCSACKFGLDPENVSLPRMIQVESHEHPWLLLSISISFICNFCGTNGICAPYVCSICDLAVHKNCISLPQKIKITRHPHKISHSYFLPQNQCVKWDCRICYDEVNAEYGSYYCSVSNCNYIAHVKCAIDGISSDECASKDKEENPDESLNLITAVIETMTVGEGTIAKEIKHRIHPHNLIMTFGGEIKTDDDVCDGCMRNVSIPFYSCEQCGFFLHKHCAELPRVKQHAIHKHQLTLTWYKLSFCVACSQHHQGFSYYCKRKSCGDFGIDIQCSLLPDSLIHPSHEHILLLTHENQRNCSGCNNKNELAYRCKERCGFALGFECLTLPRTTRYKYDEHLLHLTYYENSEPSQIYCDICEEKRHPNSWFYYCSKCDNSVHPECILGCFPFIKLGTLTVSPAHTHVLKFDRKIWNSPPCHGCGKLCTGQALQCDRPYCNGIFHVECIYDWSKLQFYKSGFK